MSEEMPVVIVYLLLWYDFSCPLLESKGYNQSLSTCSNVTFPWSFILDEVDERTTRLIVRMRANAGPRLFRLLTFPLFLPADFVMARLMLRGIKQRAERAAGMVHSQSRQDEPSRVESQAR
jgi:hypothetical protein